MKNTQTVRVGELVIELDNDGTTLVGDSSKITPETLLASSIIANHWRAIGIPGFIVNLGKGYIWPPGTKKRKIRPAGIRCPHCQKSVKRAFCLMGKVFMCDCMAVILTPRWTGREPRNSSDWTEARTEGVRRQVVLEARTAKGNN